MNPITRFSAARLLALALLIPPSAGSATAVPTTPEQTFQLALEAQTAREYRDMLALLRQAARAGHLEAQEMLGLTLLTGPALYGPVIKTDRCEAGDWMRRAAAQGSEIGLHQLTFLNRLRNAPGGKAACQKAGG